MEDNKRPIRGNLILGIILVIISLFVIIYANLNFPHFKVGMKKLPGPKFFPTILSLFILICGIYEITFAFIDKKNKKAISNTKRSFKELINDWGVQNILIFSFSIILYVPIINFLGFFIGSVLISSVLLYRLNVGLLKSLIVSLILSFIIIMLFEKLFKIQLPAGILNMYF